MAKIDRKTFAQLKKIVLAFFVSELKWKAIGLLVLLATFSVSISAVNVMISFVQRDFMTALSLRDREGFSRQLYYYLAAFAVATPFVVFYRYTEERLGLLWRKWLSRHLLAKYFANRAYYKINFFGGIDNPDQRIEEDIRSFTTTCLSFLLIIFNSLIALYFFMGILWSISINLVITVVAYSFFGSIATYFLGRPLIGLNFSQLKKEADYRYKLVNIRDNSESIAFLRDEKKELTRTRQRLKFALNNLLSIINWNRNLNFFTTGYNYLISILPIIVVAPLYFDGKIEFGVVTQAASAFSQVLGALSIIVLNFGSLSAFAAVINRLGSFWDVLDQAQSGFPEEDYVKIRSQNGSQVEFSNVTVMTPKKDQTLVRNLSFQISEGGLLINGPSGTGKSSILRVIAGLWDSGVGNIVRPDPKNSMFLPQRPYMALGTLRDQLMYSVRRTKINEQDLLDTMKLVGLEDTYERLGSLDKAFDWPNILSTGEQQRLAFARMVLARPHFVLLDEATTAIDSSSEEELYKLVQKTAAVYISVGYRAALSKFHCKILTLKSGGTWKIEDLGK